ncbi:hypothetical protein [Labrys sp. WJW]|uniref:hypothetical protein n=1 Tax=Labrys sp. WJW TaxID=1737983 RepID=UPI0012EA39DC|nr:hypothetical protein [Labrys sp. WJW]
MDLTARSVGTSTFVIIGLVPVIQGFDLEGERYLDARGKPGHDKIRAIFLTSPRVSNEALKA